MQFFFLCVKRSTVHTLALAHTLILCVHVLPWVRVQEDERKDGDDEEKTQDCRFWESIAYTSFEFRSWHMIFNRIDGTYFRTQNYGYWWIESYMPALLPLPICPILVLCGNFVSQVEHSTFAHEKRRSSRNATHSVAIGMFKPEGISTIPTLYLIQFSPSSLWNRENNANGHNLILTNKRYLE